MFTLYPPLFLSNFKLVSPQWYSEACRRLPNYCCRSISVPTFKKTRPEIQIKTPGVLLGTAKGTTGSIISFVPSYPQVPVST